MHFLRTLLVRNNSASASASLSPLTARLLVALLILAILGIALLGTLRARRRRKQARRPTLPLHSPRQETCRSHRRLTITAAPYGRHSQVFVVDEKHGLCAEAESPCSPVPEIRITFPDEPDAEGKCQSGRVVVVQLNENGSVGLGPCAHEDLPPYQSGERFQSLDLERMGGLKEKELEKWF
jgi:hypothetical protein